METILLPTRFNTVSTNIELIEILAHSGKSLILVIRHK